MKVLGDSIGRQYYKEVAEGNFRASYGLTKEEDSVVISLHRIALESQIASHVFRTANSGLSMI